MDAIAEIKRLYYAATKATIRDDLERAIDLLKSLSTEEQRESAAVYMDGLAQMRSEWSASARPKAGELRRELAEATSGREGGSQAARRGVTTSTSGSRPSASARPNATLPARSGRSKSSSRRFP